MAQSKMDGLRKLFVDQLKDIYWVEKELVKTMPKMSKKASANKLVDALTEHHSVTEEQVNRLESVFSAVDVKPRGKKCEGMSGILSEGEEMMKETESGSVMDAAIIAASQKVEHYEIATYGTLSTWAQILNEEEAVTLLNEILEEEKKADKKLTKVASSINMEAAEETENVSAE